RIFGPYWWYWWFGMLFCNVLSPQLFWFRWCRHNVLFVFFVCMCVTPGSGFGPAFSAIVMESFSPHLGRYLDLYRHDWNFHFAVPSIHPFPSDDRNVGSEDGHT